MFQSLGWGEIVVILLAALFIFGPERLPALTKDAAAALRRARRTIRDVRQHMDNPLGPELAPLRTHDLNRHQPKRLIREHLLGDNLGPPPVP